MTVIDLKCHKCQPLVDKAREQLAILNALCSVEYTVLSFTCTAEEQRKYIDNATKRWNEAFNELFDSHSGCFDAARS